MFVFVIYSYTFDVITGDIDLVDNIKLHGLLAKDPHYQ